MNSPGIPSNCPNKEKIVRMNYVWEVYYNTLLKEII